MDVESVSEHGDFIEGESLCEDEVFRFGWEDELGGGEGVGICRRLSGQLGEGSPLSEALMQALGELDRLHVDRHVDTAWAFPFMLAVDGPVPPSVGRS